MGVRNSATEKVVFLYCSTTGLAIGRSFDTEADADAFSEWFDKEFVEGSGRDMRTLSAEELEEARAVFERQRELFAQEGIPWEVCG